MGMGQADMSVSVRRKELIRGKILYYLALVFPQPSTLHQLQGELDFFGYPIPMEELNFHVAYLAEKGFVSIEALPRPNRRDASQVKITAKGIDYYDGRLEPDEGVYLGPRGQGPGSGH